MQALDKSLNRQEVGRIAWWLLIVGTFGCVLVFLCVFSRAFLLARLNRAEKPDASSVPFCEVQALLAGKAVTSWLPTSLRSQT